MCTGSQNIIESYYMLKEILNFQKPEMIIYDIYLNSFTDNIDYYHVLSNGSFMTTKGEFDLIINGFGLEGIINYIFPILKHNNFIKNDFFELFKNNNIQTKYNDKKWNKGHFLDDRIIDSISINKLQPIKSFKNTAFSKKNFEYFYALLELCKINGIKLICVRAPYPPSRLEISTSDTVYTFFKKTCKDSEIPFYDFNYSLNITYDDLDFSDDHHTNKFGANKVSRQLAEKLSKIITTHWFLLFCRLPML